jgi:hypothetical protein
MILKELSGIPGDLNLFNRLKMEFIMMHLKKMVLRYIDI